jgi:hypothetical protein
VSLDGLAVSREVSGAAAPVSFGAGDAVSLMAAPSVPAAADSRRSPPQAASRTSASPTERAAEPQGILISSITAFMIHVVLSSGGAGRPSQILLDIGDALLRPMTTIAK